MRKSGRDLMVRQRTSGCWSTDCASSSRFAMERSHPVLGRSHVPVREVNSIGLVYVYNTTPCAGVRISLLPA